MKANTPIAVSLTGKKNAFERQLKDYITRLDQPKNEQQLALSDKGEKSAQSTL